MATRKITDLVGGVGTSGPPSSPSLYGPDDDSAIPGEIVVALEPSAAANIAVSIPHLPERPGLAAVTAFGAETVDGILGSLKVVSIARVYGPSPAIVTDGHAIAADLGLDGVFRIRYSNDDQPSAVAGRLALRPDVAWAEPNYRRETAVVPNDPRFGEQWGLTRINAPTAWDTTTGDPSVVVAVVDTGIDLNHPDLAPLLVPGQDLVDWPPGSVPKAGWVFEGDFTGVDADPQDEVGHGTHVAGTICALSNNGVGVAGVNWNARLMPVRVLARIRNTTTNQVSGSGSSANIAAGIRWAADNGARVINMSLIGYGDATVEREAVAYAVSKGVVIVAAMGNDSTATPGFPASYPGVVAVAATDSADRRASFSNTGAHVSISGPGVGILSTYWDDTYATLDGTSMASPHVAGVAALVLARNGNLTAAQVADVLRTTAKPLRDDPGEAIPNDRYGYGLVQADAAVSKAGPPVQSLQIICQTRPVICRPSVITVCVSRQVICISQRVICQSLPAMCQRSVATPCVSLPVLCRPSVGTICPSLGRCPSIACQSLACGAPGDAGAGEADWSAYDPYDYDPYGTGP